jgi:hypothetical protein
MTKGSEDYNKGKHLPSPVTPATTVCFKIVIPNAVEYRAALFGVLGPLSQWYTWEHPTDGTTCVDCEEAAQLWAKAISEAYFEEDCEGTVSCEDVADCIETDEGTQQALAGVIETNEAIQQALADQIASNNSLTNSVYNTTVVGSPMLPEQRNAGVSKTTDCNPDKLFGSITAIVEQLDTNNRDFLEVILLTDNAQQRVSKIIKAIPLLNEVPIDEALDFASQMAIEIKENYDSQWTTAIKDEYRCDLFCLVKEREGCELTFQDMVAYFNTRLGTSLEPINFFQAVVTYFVAGTWSGTTVIDIMMLIQLSAWQQASEWTGISLRTLQTVGALGANDPDPDWTLLCDECGDDCLPSWSTITWFQGTVSSHSGDFWNITSITPVPAPTDTVIRNVQYGTWTNGNYILKSIENLTGGSLAQIYIERNNGTVLYNGTSVAAAQALLPACVRFIQVYRLKSAGAFTMRFEIDN